MDSSTLPRSARSGSFASKALLRKMAEMGKHEDEVEASDTLHYGDFISLFSMDEQGFVAANFSTAPHQALTIIPNDSRTNPSLGNFRSAVFELQPVTKYKAKKDLQKAMDKYKRKGESGVPYEAAMARAEKKEDQAKLRELKIIADAEDEDNRKEYNRRFGDEIKYGSIVMLRHVHLESFVKMSTTVTSRTEPASMKVDLWKSPDRHSWFKVMPRYKVRAEGEPVRVLDQIILESVKTAGQYIHICKEPIADVHPDAGQKEVNLAVISSSFSIDLVCSAHEYNEDMLMGGDVIQLFHKEISAFLAAEGVFTDEPTEDVHLRIRHPDPRRPSRLMEPTSAVSYWQVELAKNSTSGRIIPWEAEVKLKHVSTRRYLSLVPTGHKTFKTMLVTDGSQDSCKFQFFPVVREQDAIQKKSYTRIRHVKTGCWLHANERDVYTRQGRKNIEESPTVSRGLVERVEKIKWDKANLVHLSASEKKKFDDAFIIKPVDKKYIYNVAYVSGVVESLNKCISIRQKGEYTEHQATEYEAVMDELVTFLEEDGKPVKTRQKLLRNFEIVEIVIRLLKSPFVPFNPSGIKQLDMQKKEYAGTKRVCEAAYTVLEYYLRGDSRKNELYAARYIPYFHSQLGCRMNVERMYTELITDNYLLLDTISDEEITQIVNLLRKDKNPDYLDFLSALCACRGGPLPRNQIKICKLLLEEAKGAIYLTTYDKATRVLQVNTTGGKGEWRPLQELCGAAKGDDDKHASVEYRFFKRQLELLGKLCLGRNSYCIEVITRKLDILGWEECFFSMGHLALPASLRAKYVSLCINLFIDVDNNQNVLYQPKLNFAWNELTENPFSESSADPSRSITGATMPFFEQLHGWMFKYLSSQDKIYHNEVSENKFLAAVLDLLYYLVSFGYYINPKDILELLGPLTDVTDGRDDCQLKDVASSVKFSNPEDEEKQKKAHEDWQKTGRYANNAANDIVARVKSNALRVISAIMNLATTFQLSHFLYDFKQMNSAPSAGGRVRASRKGKLFPAFHDSILHQILTAKDEDEDSLFRLTPDVRRYVRDLFDKSNWLTPDWHPSDVDVEPHDLIFALEDLLHYDYNSLLTASQGLLMRIYSSREDLFRFAGQARVLITQNSVSVAQQLSSMVPTLSRLAVGYVEPGEVEQYVSIVSQITGMCFMDPTDKSSPAHPINQGLIFNTGVMYTLFDVVSKDRQAPEVYAQSFKCLRAMAIGFAPVQNAVFNQLETFMTIALQSDIRGWQNSFASLVAEIFTGNMDLCLSIKPSFIESLMDLLSKYTTEVPNALLALCAIMKIDELDLPLKRNQAFVIKSLMEYRSTIVSPAFIDDGSDEKINQQRLNLLHETIPDPTTKKLQEYHSYLVDLFASCAEGENIYIESMCQTIFSIPEIIEVLTDDIMDAFLKTCYLRFFLWVYLNNPENAETLREAKIASNMDLWRAFGSISETLLGIHSYPSQKECELIFLGLIPCMMHLVRDHFEPNGSEQVYKQVKKFANNVGEFFNAVGKELTSKAHLKELSMLVMAMFQKDPRLVPAGLSDDISARLTAVDSGLALPPLVAKYNATYKTELSLNDRIDKFANRMLKIYGGANTVADQIPLFHGDVGMDRISGQDLLPKMYCEKDGSDEALPLSPEFQAQLKRLSEWVDDVAANKKNKNKKDGKIIKRHVISYNVNALFRLLSASKKYGSSRDAMSNMNQARLDIRAMQLLRGLIHNLNRVGKSITDFQEQMAPGVLQLMYMMDSENNEVVREALACLVTLLQDGSKAVQKKFQEYFLSTREENFFVTVQARMRRSMENMQELRLLNRSIIDEQKKRDEMMGTLTMANKLTRKSIGLAGIDSGAESTVDGGATVRGKKTIGNEMEMVSISDTSSAVSSTAKEFKTIEPRDEGNIELLLRVMQNLCEGGNKTLKAYLRSQPDNIRTIDLIAETVEFLAVAVEEISNSSIPMIIQTMETLVELCQGDADNQDVVFDNHIIDHVNFVLRITIFPNCAEVLVAKLKQACANLVLAMVEENSEHSRMMAKDLEDTLDISAIIRNMNVYYEFHLDGEDASWVEEDDDDPPKAEDVGFLFYSILLRLQDFLGKDYARLQQYNLDEYDEDEEEVHCDAADFFDKKRVSIEIIRNDEIQKLHFLNKWGDLLREEVKEKLIWTVNRNSPTDKIADFVERVHVIIEDIYYLEKMQRNFLSRMIMKYSSLWSNLLLLAVFLMNILILVSWKAPESSARVLPVFRNDWFNEANLVLGIIICILSGLVMTSYFMVNPPDIGATAASIPFVGGWLEEKVESLRKKEKNRTKYSLLSLESLHHILLVVLACLGTVYDGYFFCYHPFHVIINNDILLRAISAVTKNGKSLLWVAALMVLIIYVYAVIGFALLRDKYASDDGGVFCGSLWQCFVTSLKYGLINGGGLAETLKQEDALFWRFELRVIFDLSFFIIITTIALNVVFGIIVDTFSELRDEKYQIEEAMESECFICSLKNYDFEKDGKGFHYHVKHEHRMWDYLFFFMHLKTKPETEMTSHEYYVLDLINKKEEVKLFPINRALSLQNNKEEEKGLEQRYLEQEDLLKAMNDRIDFVLTKLQEKSAQ